MLINDDLFIGGIALFGGKLNSEYEEQDGDMVLTKVEPARYKEYTNLPGVTIIGKGAAKKSTIDKLVITSSVTRVQTSAFKGCGTKIIEIEDGDKPLTFERHALDLQHVDIFVCPNRLDTLGEQYIGFTTNVRDNSRFIGGEGLSDFDLRLLRHFETVDLTKCNKAKLQLTHLDAFSSKLAELAGVDMKQMLNPDQFSISIASPNVSRSVLLPFGLMEAQGEETAMLLNAIRNLAISKYGEDACNYNY